jgi:biotin operon repressor
MEPADELLRFFKALSDESRLKIVGLLAREGQSGEALAAMLGLQPATVSHHLARLAEAGLVTARMQGHAKIYSLRLDMIHAMAHRLLKRDTLPAAATEVDLAAYDRKVLGDFLRPDGSLREIPAQQKKLRAVLRHIVNDFAPGREYGEKQVNAMLARYHPDTASLRRELIGHKLMRRARGKYWRVTGAGDGRAD